jgi:hypothetical protein
MTAGDVIGIKGALDARQGASFDGADDYILADAHAVARVAGNDTTGTYSAWIYMDNIQQVDDFISAGDNDSANEYLAIQVNAQRLKIELKHGGAIQFAVIQTTETIPEKKWTYIAVVQDGIQPALYVNGLKVATTNTTATDLTYWYDKLTGCDKFAIGVLESNGTHAFDWDGMISDVKYWNRGLSAAEVLADKNGEALTGDGTYLQLHLLKSNSGTFGYGVADQGLGDDDGTLTGHAYLNGWGSEWSRGIDLSGAVVADNITSCFYDYGNERMAASAVIKAA